MDRMMQNTPVDVDNLKKRAEAALANWSDNLSAEKLQDETLMQFVRAVSPEIVIALIEENDRLRRAVAACDDKPRKLAERHDPAEFVTNENGVAYKLIELGREDLLQTACEGLHAMQLLQQCATGMASVFARWDAGLPLPESVIPDIAAAEG